MFKGVDEMKNEVVVNVVDVFSLKMMVKESECHLDVGTVLLEEGIYCLEVNALDKEENEILLTDNLNIKVAIHLVIFFI